MLTVQNFFPLILTSLVMALALEELVDMGADFLGLPPLPNRISHFLIRKAGRKEGSLDSKQRKVKDIEKHLALQERKMTQAEAGRNVPWMMNHENQPHVGVIENINHHRKRVTFQILESKVSACVCNDPICTFTSDPPICICVGCGELARWQVKRKTYTATALKNRGAKAAIPTESPASYDLAEQLLKYVTGELK
jgi:hypothetical protein